MRQIRTSSFSKFFGVSQHDSIGFDEQNIYIVQKSGSKKTVGIDTISDFYRSSGMIWDDFTIILSNGTKEVIDGISSAESLKFIEAFDREFAKSYYAFQLNRFKQILNAFPPENQYWKRSHYKILCAHAKQLYGTFAYRKILPSSEDKKQFELIAKLSKNDWMIHKEHNQRFIQIELKYFENYFDYVEKKPLTQKQREAVVLNERSNLVIAGAGSGKTSVMVARVGYIMRKYDVQPHEILLLAFNRSAAEELQARISERLHLSSIKSSTFHALGLEVIAKADGKKPSLAKAAEDEKEFDKLLITLIDRLGQENHAFVADMERFLTFPFAKYRSDESFKSDKEYALYLQKNDIRTLKGEKVKSFEEAEIANFFFIHNIQYQYEPYYPHVTANEQYRQYQPDFYLSEYNIYLEHFGVDEEGNTAPYIIKEEYAQGMEWKRALHTQYDTVLIETYSYEKRKGVLTDNLLRKLQEHGIKSSPKPLGELMSSLVDEKKKSNPIIKLFGTFLNNFKSNRHTIENLVKRAGDDERIRVFLKVFIPLYVLYEEHLRNRGEVDFNDMILLAANKIQSGAYVSPYRFILVDEFQDISVSRAELVKALLQYHPDNVLTAVGDDWQSINRFAGSDISIFKEFGSYFGESDSVALDYTFRYNNKIAEVSKRFIECNPSQIIKPIKTLTTAAENCVHVWWNPEKEIDQLFAKIVTDFAERNPNKEFSIFVLARYWFLLPQNAIISALKRSYPNIFFSLSSVHASKGLEADYVIGIGVDSGKYGFPSAMEDDPIIDIVLAKQEEYDHAEERRLFYVLLTRAKEEVHLIASQSGRSVFSIELEETQYPVIHHYPNGVKPRFCPECNEGTLVIRENGKGKFFGCSNYPACSYTEPIHACSKCFQGNLVLNQATGFYVCDNQECDYKQVACQKCNGLMLKRQNSRTKEYFMGCSNYSKGCRYTYRI
jgi:DNA helicase-4